ncbi:hypothetical protein [Occultella gossypii]|uniref:Uncharacterized protein n=1 Tax=Occultella gossypii TaxID=2800820 RepID=A0ABS7S5C2_9MICO|nr:hypothetical protein [Occultella gossypii]MBZ2195541.1 hypothetical protein [Occultella gossypii]
MISSSGLSAESLEFLQEYVGDKIGMKLELLTLQDETYASQLATVQQAGNGPDLVQWTSEGMHYLRASGINLAPLDDYVTDDMRAAGYDADFASGRPRAACMRWRPG